MKLYVGTSGYSYREWKGIFYPEKIRAKDMLPHYASRLQAVEINNTFYRLPQRTVVEGWNSQVPDNFRFTVKAPRRITHSKRLKAVSRETKLLLNRVSALENRFAAVLFQLPPNMEKDLKRLERFLKYFPTDIPAAFEFRNATWFDDDVLALLRSHNRALCVSDTDEMPVTHIDKTADWGYMRLRRVNYSETDLKEWVGRVRDQEWKRAFIFFKHEDKGTGPKLAAQFLDLCQSADIRG